MRVALESLEVDEKLCRAIRKSKGMSGRATREEVRAWAMGQIDMAIDAARDEYDHWKTDPDD